MEVGDIDGLESQDIWDIASWAVETGLWDGKPVSWEDATYLRLDIEKKLVQQLDTSQELSAEKVHLLPSFPKGEFVQVGVKKFWKKHKKKILITAAVVGVVAIVAIVAGCSGGAAGAGATAGGTEALRRLNNKLDKKEREKAEKESISSSPETPSMDALLAEQNLKSQETFFFKEGVVIGNKYCSYDQMQDQLGKIEFQRNFYPLPHTSYERPLPSNRPTFNKDWTLPQNRPLKALQNKISTVFETPGYRQPQLKIGGINGIKTSFENAQNHALYLQKLSNNQSIHWTHNQTHGLVTDVLEVGLNYLGYSPHTAELLKEEWTNFHEENIDRPQAKYLHFCHSQGAIHTRNALVNCSPEVCNRIIVVAIAPGAVIDDQMCYRAFNYASKKDPIPHAEVAFAGGLNTNELRDSELFKMMLEKHENLIFLDPHPDASDIDHDFQSPTFFDTIEKHIKSYENLSGEYP